MAGASSLPVGSARIRLEAPSFAIASAASATIAALRRRAGDDDEDLNRRAARYVGRTARVREVGEDGFAKVRIDDGYWRVRGPGLVEGQEVRVVAVDGATLLVEPVDEEGSS